MDTNQQEATAMTGEKSAADEGLSTSEARNATTSTDAAARLDLADDNQVSSMKSKVGPEKQGEIGVSADKTKDKDRDNEKLLHGAEHKDETGGDLSKINNGQIGDELYGPRLSADNKGSNDKPDENKSEKGNQMEIDDVNGLSGGVGEKMEASGADTKQTTDDTMKEKQHNEQKTHDVSMEDGEIQENGDSTKLKKETEMNGDTVDSPHEDEDESTKLQPYSTRRRQQTTSKAEAGSDLGDTSSVTGKDNASDDAGQDANSDYGGSSARPSDALLDPTREKELKERTMPSTSFLDESLSEEERRTRTRYLPDVDGIRMLYKNEIKKDVVLARSIIDDSGVSSTLSKSKKTKSKKITSKAAQDDGDRMDAVDEGDETGQSEDDRVSDVSSRISGFGKNDASDDILLPSSAFVVASTENGDSTPPIVVESLTAFDPPRPPESMGAKKKHRLMRWERRPQEVELDLNKYRQTVQKTREELHSAMSELERIEFTKSLLRTHYLNHLQNISTESNVLNDELLTIQKGCVKASDMLTSKTRSKGMSKGSYAMKDVISVLKSKGLSIKANSLTPVLSKSSSYAGVGGISSVGFNDWDRSTIVHPSPLANAWILPGDKVQTPVGDGVVIHVYGPSVASVHEPPLKDVRPKLAPATSKAKTDTPNFSRADAIKREENSESKDKIATTEDKGQKASKEEKQKSESDEVKASDGTIKDGRDKEKQSTDSIQKNASVQPTTTLSNDTTANHQKQKYPIKGKIIAPRICVRLPYSIGFFTLSSISSKEDPSSYSDSMLASRWQKMMETAPLVGCCVDVAGMEQKSQQQQGVGRRPSSSAENESEDTENETSHMDVDDNDMMKPASNSDSARQINQNDADQRQVAISETIQSDNKKAARRRVFPFGSGLLPTSTCRGALLSSLPLPVLEAEMKPFLFDGGGVLGTTDNAGVPDDASKWEGQRYELLQLRAKVLQLRNELRRQRRIRNLNERTCNMYRDRSHRVENLVSEMKTDLKNLKNRLEDEVAELGFDEEKAANLVAKHFLDQDDSESSTIDATPPPKRKRHGSDGDERAAMYGDHKEGRDEEIQDEENMYSTDTGIENEVEDEVDNGSQRVKRARVAGQ